MPELVAAPVREGDILASKYRVDSILGAGGTGVVVAATDLQLDQRVALKFLVSSGSDEQASVRSLRQARAVVRLASEHIVRVIDTGTLDNGLAYLVMELLEGRDLQQELGARGPVAVGEAVAWVLQACEGIAEAHALGIVHRDLKPAKLFLTRRANLPPLIKVLDFNLQRASDDAWTKNATFVGSPQYLSPEQITNAKSVDQRADIWALGIVLYQLLADSSPFSETNAAALMAQIVADPHRPLRLLRPDVPRGLDALVSRCLEKEPGRRFASITDFARELARFGSEDARASSERIARISLAPAFPKPAGRTVLQLSTEPTPIAIEPVQRRRPSAGTRWAVPLAVGACATLVLLWPLLRNQEAAQGTVSPASSQGSLASDRATRPSVAKVLSARANVAKVAPPALDPALAAASAPFYAGDSAVAPVAAAPLRRPIQEAIRRLDLTHMPAPISVILAPRAIASALRAPDPVPETSVNDRR